MTHRLLFCCLILLTSTFILQAQEKVTVSGFVTDAQNAETLPGATIVIPSLEKSVRSNSYGFYSITIPTGTYKIRIQYLGYEILEEEKEIKTDLKINFELKSKTQQAKEVQINVKARKDANVKGTEMGMHQLAMEQVKKLPVILGEVDVLKALQLLPGVLSAGEGQSGFYVRGGGPDQNLILLDDAVVYNTGHLFGFFSVFNGDAIKNVNLIKGGMPANYGGRLSSVVDVIMKEGNNKKYQVDGGIGLIASRLSIQGPILKNKSSFMISGRRTYIDALTKPFISKTSAFRGSGYYFYDLNTKINYILSKKDRLFLSGYFGKDVFNFNSSERTFKVNIPWGNATATMRWNHQFSNKLFMNTTAMFNNYQFAFNAVQKDIDVRLYSGIRDWSIKSDLDYFTPFNHNFKAGAVYTYHTFTPSTVSGKVDSISLNPDQSFRKYAHEMAVYVLDEFDLGKKIKINAGLRTSAFLQVGPYTRYTFNANGQKTDSVKYATSDIVKKYGGLEPRVNLRLAINASTSIKAGIAKTYQYLNLVTNNGSTLPTDIWSPSSFFVQPQRAWQYSAGFFKNFRNNQIETSMEVYYKDMRNLIEFREGYSPDNLRDVDYDFVFGKGYAYGAEWFINKTKGRWTGWLSYTLSWTWRDFQALNGGERFFSKFDQRHNISLTSTYEYNNKWTFSGVFVFGSGSKVSVPTELFTINGAIYPYIDKLNNFVLPPYHRLDLAATYTPQPSNMHRWKGSWTFSLYNVYSRQNPYFMYFDIGGNTNSPNGVTLAMKQVSIFPVLPSITYNFKFK